MKWVWRSAAAAAILVLIAAAAVKLFQVQIGTHLFERAAGNIVGADRTSELEDGLHVYLCGTGSPFPDPSRAGPCVGILAGETLLIFDSGSGSMRRLARMGFPVGQTDQVFLTHLHSDHIDGLGELMLQAWVGGSRTEPVEISGPAGTTDVVSSFVQAYEIDSGYRTAHHGEDIAPPSGFGAAPSEIDLPQDGSMRTVFEQGGARVSGFRVDHSPVSPAFGYRIDYKDRSVTISGDTVKSNAVVAAANGTDLLIHEALNRDMVAVMSQAAQDNGDEALSIILSDILDYHASPVEAAETAEAAGAGELILTHIVPPLPQRFLYPAFLKGTAEAYDGKISIGEDGHLISLPAQSEKIVHRRAPD